MESILKKSGIYGFVFGLAISILLVSYKDVIQVSNGGYVTTYKPVFEYIISILRFGIIGMFLGLFIGWKLYERNNKTEQEKSYYLPFFFAVFLVSIIMMVVFNW
ncbi:hypothetical protein [Tenuibacillus multivorans]|uniref:Uncharacterized protein n=1 Tax=Tenuibacillus multivorans TaxID=237069 RepID=A0A1G9YGJ2_9BACI|nr:hypothetical protein [Tenuibacillus multivorans]GEL78521.1 hypothetical protein TMU01_27560 [Tenuibacillus multivorans]SDN08167.1 hypothetical protein SAMN05216498_1391 [Tenuibacillus multivorans]